MFADDSLLFSKATSSTCRNLKVVLDSFCYDSGQFINNFHKSSIIFLKMISHSCKAALAIFFNMILKSCLVPYLRVHFSAPYPSKRNYRHILTKTQDRIQLWEFGFLSKAGRHTLIQSNLEALSTYLCTSSLILKAICHSINTTLHINFFWNQHKDKNGTPLIAWSTFCMPKALSGLGLCRAYPLNQAFLAKLGWKILSELDNFWVKLIKAKYLSKPAIFQCAPRSKDSYIW